MLMLLPAAVPADWYTNHRTGTNNALVPIADQAIDYSAPSWLTTAGHTITAGRPIVVGNQLLVVGEATGAVRIKKFHAATGTFLGESPDLAAPLFSSYSTPTVDVNIAKVFFGSGNVVYCLDLDTLAIDWSTPLTNANTTPSGAGYQILNGSVALGGSRVFVSTYDSSFTAAQSQLVALNATTGAVEWFALPGGYGSYGPSYFFQPGFELVIVPGSTGGGSTGTGYLRAYQASTGALEWSSNTLTVDPWTLSRQIWTDVTILGTTGFAVTYDFSAASTQLVSFDPTNGRADWIVPALSSDCPPVLAGSAVHVFGGSYSSPELAAYALIDGAELWKVSIPGSAFRNYMAATFDSIYLVSGGNVQRRSLVNGSLTGGTAGGGFADSPLTIDGLGGVYTLDNAFRVAGFGLTIPVELSTWGLE